MVKYGKRKHDNENFVIMNTNILTKRINSKSKPLTPYKDCTSLITLLQIIQKMTNFDSHIDY